MPNATGCGFEMRPQASGSAPCVARQRTELCGGGGGRGEGRAQPLGALGGARSPLVARGYPPSRRRAVTPRQAAWCSRLPPCDGRLGQGPCIPRPLGGH